MFLDLTSFSFGSSLNDGTGTPSWSTSLGQRKGYKFTVNGADSIITGMVYCSVPLGSISLSLGKGGGNIPNAQDSQECQIASKFEQVYINGKKVGSSFLMVLIKENSKSHSGRRSIKYSDKISYKNGEEDSFSNEMFVEAARKTLGIKENACWFIYSLEIRNFDELYMSAVIVNQENNEIYENSNSRKKIWETLKHEIVKEGDNLFPIQQIFFGAPGTGKSYAVNKKVGGEDNPNVIRTTFHPDSDYSSFIGCYKPIEKANGEITYKFSPQAFTKAYVSAWENQSDKIFLVIEEINRGNCAQIFGDIFQLLDRDSKTGESSYTISPDNDLEKYLKEEFENEEEIPDADIKSGKKMKLPSNLSIYATMNTSDQSLFPIDSAFKRRWDWKYIPINKDEEGHYIECGDKQYDWWNFLEKVNPKIDITTGSEDKQLGFWFAKPEDENGKITAEKFVSKVVFYLWNDVLKDYTTDGNNIFKTNDKLLKFRQFFKSDGTVDEDVLNQFLDGLNVVYRKGEDSAKDYTKYSINGEGK